MASFKAAGTAQNGVTATTITLAAPAGISQGDLLLALLAFNTNSSSDSFTPPSGWTSLVAATAGSTGCFFVVYYKIAGSSEPGSYTFTPSSSSTYCGGVVLDYTGVDPSPFDVLGTPSTSSTAASITTTKPDDVVIGLWIENSDGGPPVVPSGFTSRASSPSSGNDYPGFQIADYTLATAGATGTKATTGSGASSFASVLISLSGGSAPSAPTLTAPANGGYLDVSAGVTFQSTYNSTDNANENAYALEQKVSTAGSYSYWNASSSTWQSTVVWNSCSIAPSATTSVGPITTGLSDGNVYNWSMASQEATANLQGPFATASTFTAQAAPTVTANAPTGTVVNTTTPTVTWTTSPASGASQISYEVIVESGTYGTTPGSGTQAWSSGVVTSSAQAALIGSTLANGTTYRAFVQVSETGGISSSWSYVTFTISLDAPAIPALTAVAATDPTTGCPYIALTVQGRDNLLTAIQASFEGATTGWAAGTSTAIADTTAQALDGSYSMSLTRQTSTGTSTANTPTGTSGVAVVAGATYQALASFRSAATARACTVAINWYQSNGSPSAITPTSTSSSVNDTTTGWTQAYVTAAAPSDAAYAAVVVSVASAVANEVHYVDEVDVGPGTSSLWTRGGLVGSTTVAILRSDGQYVRGAGFNGTTSIPSPGESVTVNDYEVTPGVAYTYAAVVSAVVGGSTISSSASTATAAVTISWTGSWYAVIFAAGSVAPTALIPLNVMKYTLSRIEQSAVALALGNTNPSVNADQVAGPGGSAQVETQSATQAGYLTTLVTAQSAFWLMSPYGLGQTGRLGPTGVSSASSNSEGNTVQSGELQASPTTTPYEISTLNWVQVGRA